MLKNTKLVAGVIVLAVAIAIVALWNSRRGGEGVIIDLLTKLNDAQQRSTWTQTNEPLFNIKDVTIAGKTHKAIFAPPMSRIKFKIEVPRRGMLEIYYALREDAWTVDNDGAQFRIGVGDGRTYEEYLKEAINPKGRERDRKWLQATIDLSAYEGQMVEIILNTDYGASDTNNGLNDFCLWGDPKVKGR